MADIRRLLYSDFDGRMLDSPEPIVGRGLVDDRHQERVPGLASVLDDPAIDPFDRLFACLALTAWGEGSGYRAVAAAAAGEPPWHGLPRGRLRRADSPFALVAAQVGLSDGMAARKGTESLRIDALRALVGIADREDFGDQLSAAISTGPPSVVAVDVVATAHRGLRRLDHRPLPRFDLPCQLVDILEPLVEVDEPTVLALVREIVRRDPSPHTLGYVAFLVATATTSVADALAAHIVAVGGPSVAERLAEARARQGPPDVR
jgi:hypothetical protein